MAKFLFAIVLLLSSMQRIPGPGGKSTSTPSGHTFTDVGGKNFTCSTSPCTISGYTATSGNLLVITFANQLGSDYITALSGGGSWTIPAGCQVTDTGTSESCAYIISNSGASSFSLSFTTNSATASGTLFEWSYTGSGSVAIDGSPATASNSTGTTQTMISPTITGTSDLVAQGITTHSGHNISSFTGAYTVDEQGSTRGQVHLTNTTSTTAPVANLSSTSAAQICELAFK